MKNELYIEKLGDWFRESCIVETEDDVYYDAYLATLCAQQGIAIDDDTRICEDVQLYYFNDCSEFHYEYETDIDLG